MPISIHKELRHRGEPLVEYLDADLWNAVGGSDGVAALIKDLYRRIEKDKLLRVAFPHFDSAAALPFFIQWFGGNRGEIREALNTGAVTDVKLPSSGQGEFVLRSPDGSTRKLPTGVLTATVGPLDKCGVWAVVPAGGGDPVQEIACNLASRAESDIRPPENLPQSAAESSVVTGLLGRPVWFYLIALAWVLAATEWYLYQRRWIS